MRPLLSLGRYEPGYEKAMARAAAESYVGRIWKKDPAVWSQDPDHQKIIRNSLGWLTVPAEMKGRTREILDFTDLVRRQGFRSVCLLGMGGSSLCPEICALTFGTRAGYLDLIVLDTTDPASILSAENRMDLARTLFLVSSKSGGTIESACLHKYFFEKISAVRERPGSAFVAITDPGTSLEKLAKDQGFLKVFLNPQDIGGRYSALSFFGLVPMALIGMDPDEVLDRAGIMASRCRAADPAENPALALGVALGALARAGLDKATFVLAPEIAAFGYWVEQLIAESTGKQGVGIVPVEGEALGDPAVYSDDRVFVHIDLAHKNDPSVNRKLRALEQAGHPVIRWELTDTLALAGEFFRWEFATAAAGAEMGIDPFDQPNVQESKDNTRRLIQQYQATGSVGEPEPVLREGLLALYCSPELAGKPGAGALAGTLRAFVGQAKSGDYIALLAYLKRSPSNAAFLEKMRNSLRDRTHKATTLGYGPRFLHSTGQLHKGGANSGLFVEITAAGTDDVPIPGESYSFAVLKEAQAFGDLQALAQHGRRAVRLHIEGNIPDGLEQLRRALESS